MHGDIPQINLRMKSTKLLSLRDLECDSDACLETLAVMTSQDALYRCRDYIVRHENVPLTELRATGITNLCSVDDYPDISCREKMCEWSYRVCDHFHTNREIVAYTFSFLDRFVDNCKCDRTSFKLASMTCLYMAMKIFNTKQISIASLSELSRGEFDVNHIADMERIILETLEWRMNPPTVQAFIERLHPLVPLHDPESTPIIYQRAQFFAELSIYDYELIVEERYLIAVACILNAMESMEDEYIHGKLPLHFFSKLSINLCVHLEAEAVEHVQSRLWFLYSCSAQILYEDIIPLHVIEDSMTDKRANVFSSQASSPISVDDAY